MTTLTLGLYQCRSPAGDLAWALETAAKALAKAKAAGVDMLVMPELFLPGYLASNGADEASLAHAMEQLRQSIADHGVGLTIGACEFDQGKMFNSAFAFGKDGIELARYRKIQLYGEHERSIFEPGGAYVDFIFMGRRAGLLICYDVEFPEHVRALAKRGCELIFVPTANMKPYTFVGPTIVPARALESEVAIVYANYCGDEGHLNYTGQSSIATPDLGLAAITNVEGEELISCTWPSANPAWPPIRQLDDLRQI